MASMFWGLKMEPGKRYSTTVDKSFHISKATLDANTVSSEHEIVSVVLEESGGGVFFLTNLRKRDLLASNLDLNFMTGDQITLFCKGQGTVHLSGYMVPDDDDDFGNSMLDDEAEDEEGEDEEVDEEEIDDAIMNSKASKKIKADAGIKRKQENEKTNQLKKKKLELPSTEDSDEDDSDDINGGNMGMADESEDDDEDDNEEEEEDEEDSDEEDDEPPTLMQSSKQKKKQQQNQSPQIKQKTTPNKVVNGTASPQQQEGKKSHDNQKPQQGVEMNLTGGVKVKDIRPGNGPVCKPGKSASVYYTGRLKSNGKVFDSVTKGSGFKFRVGQGEVIKGWDIGVSGMKVGGKRIITCPPQVAYGQKGSPPQIPPNATLVFEVELRAVN